MFAYGGKPGFWVSKQISLNRTLRWGAAMYYFSSINWWQPNLSLDKRYYNKKIHIVRLPIWRLFTLMQLARNWCGSILTLLANCITLLFASRMVLIGIVCIWTGKNMCRQVIFWPNAKVWYKKYLSILKVAYIDVKQSDTEPLF